MLFSLSSFFCDRLTGNEKTENAKKANIILFRGKDALGTI